MNYTRLPVSAVLKGPLLHTPQGISCVVFSVLFILLATLSIVAPELIVSTGLLRFGAGLFCWPVVLFALFVRDSAPSFDPSLWATLMQVAFGSIPFLAANPLF